MPTQKQRDANRSNAQHSTGAKTPAGHAASSHNSLTHGLLASDLTILADPGSRDAAAALLQDFNDFYLPRSPIERALIRQMAILQYRLEAAPALETGIFTHSANTRFKASLKESGTFEPEQQRSWRNQIRGLVFADDCEGPNAIPKLIRYETALSNRFLKCVDRFLRSRQSGADQPGEPARRRRKPLLLQRFQRNRRGSYPLSTRITKRTQFRPNSRRINACRGVSRASSGPRSHPATPAPARTAVNAPAGPGKQPSSAAKAPRNVRTPQPHRRRSQRSTSLIVSYLGARPARLPPVSLASAFAP